MRDNCKTVRREIDELDIGQDLSSDAREHVQSCEHCRSFYEGRRELRLMLGSLETVAAPSDFEFRVRARLANQEVGRHSGFFGNRSLGIPVATVATLVFLLGAGFAFRSLVTTDNRTTAVSSGSQDNNQADTAKQKKGAIDSNTVPTNGGDGTVKVNNTTPDAVREPRPRVKSFGGIVASQRTSGRQATQEFSTFGASVVRQDDAMAGTETSPVFAVETSSEPLKVSLDYETGVSRTISLPTLSFGSQRTLVGNNAAVKTSTKSVW